MNDKPPTFPVDAILLAVKTGARTEADAVAEVARGEVEENKAPRPGLSGQHPCLKGGQVTPVHGPESILLGEGPLAEQDVSIAGKPDDPLHVLVGEGHVGHVGDLLPLDDPQDPFA